MKQISISNAMALKLGDIKRNVRGVEKRSAISDPIKPNKQLLGNLEAETQSNLRPENHLLMKIKTLVYWDPHFTCHFPISE